MRKNNYYQILFVVEDTTACNQKFDFDKVLDGSYNFNVSEVSIVYDLVHTIESIAASKEILKCTRQDNSLLKEFKYQFNKNIYEVSRLYTNDESTFIKRISSAENEAFVTEQELMSKIEQKCISIRNMLNNVYRAKSGKDTAG